MSLGCIGENEWLDDSLGNNRDVRKQGGHDRSASKTELEELAATTRRVAAQTP